VGLTGLLRVSAMVEAHPAIAELDCNPVKVLADGAVVLDARSGSSRLLRRRWPPAADQQRGRGHGAGHRPAGIGQVWTGSPVRWWTR
jgi:hypothetical protein